MTLKNLLENADNPLYVRIKMGDITTTFRKYEIPKPYLTREVENWSIVRGEEYYGSPDIEIVLAPHIKQEKILVAIIKAFDEPKTRFHYSLIELPFEDLTNCLNDNGWRLCASSVVNGDFNLVYSYNSLTLELSVDYSRDDIAIKVEH